MKSILYVTTATSGSASIWRVLGAMLAPSHRMVSSLPSGSGGKASLADLQPEGHVYLVRGLNEMNGPVHDPRFRYVVNFRDPRDMLCNQYHWLVQHPPGKGDDEEKKRKTIADRRARHERGIDDSVLRVRDDRGFSFVFELQEAARAGGDVLFISYAQLCCAFDLMVGRLESFLGVAPAEAARRAIEMERTDNLASNPQWIGQAWTGTDIMPGRHRQELRPETIATLNARFAGTLGRLKEMEVPELRHLYD